MIRLIKENNSSYEKNMEKIHYYAKRVMDDINRAAKVFLDAREEFTPIEPPEIAFGDEFFWEWAVTDYMDDFANIHGGSGDVEKVYTRRGYLAYNVIYGQFSADELYEHGDAKESLMDMVCEYGSMDDLYFVTCDNYHTLEELANDPYAVFDDVFGDDEKEKENYAYEVAIEFDLLTQSDRVYDMTSDAEGFVKLYNEVSDYLSYDNLELLWNDYSEQMEEE